MNNQQLIEIISKSQVRYIGIMCAQQESDTITLCNVTSYGTEGRQCQVFVPHSNKIYEYIIFKKCNIKSMVNIPNEYGVCKCKTKKKESISSKNTIESKKLNEELIKNKNPKVNNLETLEVIKCQKVRNNLEKTKNLGVYKKGNQKFVKASGWKHTNNKDKKYSIYTGMVRDPSLTIENIPTEDFDFQNCKIVNKNFNDEREKIKIKNKFYDDF
ncbi:Protein LSM14 like protein B-B [Astathelohania contejeani]|uniref:Protein LSM14 like protein B-B n=1 Tax=Astathelohania contejeani TaxID=164912 RepID=A0ABQ7HW48_9MICR|nr:Protein LSM14 like protein B-B [Thelohania contejeani]